MISDGFLGGGGGAEHRWPVRGIWFAHGLYCSNKQYGVVPQPANYSIKPAGIKGHEKARMQIAKIRKFWAAIYYDFVQKKEPGYRTEEMPRSL